MLMDFIIYTLCFCILAAAFSLIISRSPVQAVLILVLAFLKTTVLFFAYGAEFLGILLITVYIGAIAILFLFVVMLLNLRIVELYSAIKYHIPIGAFVGILFILILLIICLHDFKIFKLSSEDPSQSLAS
jgi:NADH-quinone oxidoreductase subunit J